MHTVEMWCHNYQRHHYGWGALIMIHPWRGWDIREAAVQGGELRSLQRGATIVTGGIRNILKSGGAEVIGAGRETSGETGEVG